MFDHNARLHTESGQLVMEWQARLYGRDVLLFIRREFDYQNGTENILHLLREMQARPKILSRGRYREFCKKLPWADEDAKMAFADAFWNKIKFIGDGNADSDYFLIPPESRLRAKRLRQGSTRCRCTPIAT